MKVTVGHDLIVAIVSSKELFQKAGCQHYLYIYTAGITEQEGIILRQCVVNTAVDNH